MTTKPLNNWSTATFFQQSTREGISTVKKAHHAGSLWDSLCLLSYTCSTQNGWKGFPLEYWKHPLLSGKRVRHLFEESSCWKWRSLSYYEIAFQPVPSVITKGCTHLWSLSESFRTSPPSSQSISNIEKVAKEKKGKLLIAPLRKVTAHCRNSMVFETRKMWIRNTTWPHSYSKRFHTGCSFLSLFPCL